MREYRLQEFLDSATPFLETETLEKFKEKLALIPEAQASFQELLLHDPFWFAAAMRSMDVEGHFHVFFHSRDELLQPWDTPKVATLNLRMFEMGTKPVIVVTRFVANAKSRF